MEADAVVDIFCASKVCYNLQYRKFVGDGDTISYPIVVNANRYPGYEVVKSECVGHVQKHVGTRLRKIKTTCKDNAFIW